MSNINVTMVEQSTNTRENFFDAIWRSWCRLCAKADAQSINVISAQYASSMNESICNIDMAHIIGVFFRVQINEDDKLPQVICPECCTRVKNLNQFTDRVNKTQQMYDELLKCTDKERRNLNGVLLKYGIFKDEPLKPQFRRELPVEEIFISDASVTDNVSAVKIDVKTEKVSVDQTPALKSKSDQQCEFLDPIGDDSLKLDSESFPSSEDEYSSSDDFSFTGLNSRESKNFGNQKSCNKKPKKPQRRLIISLRKLTIPAAFVHRIFNVEAIITHI